MSATNRHFTTKEPGCGTNEFQPILSHKNQNQTAKMMMRFVSPLLLAVGLLALTTTHHVASAASPSEVIIRNGRRMGPMGRNRNRGNSSNNNLGSRMTAEAKASASRNAAAKARKEQTQRRRRLTAAVVANGSFEGSAVSSVSISISQTFLARLKYQSGEGINDPLTSHANSCEFMPSLLTLYSVFLFV